MLDPSMVKKRTTLLAIWKHFSSSLYNIIQQSEKEVFYSARKRHFLTRGRGGGNRRWRKRKKKWEEVVGG